MWTRISYFSRETLVSLRRNVLMTIAGIATVAVSLVAVRRHPHAVEVGRPRHRAHQGRGHARDLHEGEGHRAADRRRSRTSSTATRAKGNVKSYRHLTKDDAYKEFKRIFRRNPDLVNSIRAQDLPESFRVVPKKAELTETVKSEFETVQGVESVETPGEALKGLIDVTNTVRWIFVVISLILLASSMFLIVNTIRLATFARRREIEVMKLVGASNWFVRIPFIAEGMVQGIVGAGLAIIAVASLKHWGFDQAFNDPNSFFSEFFVTTGDATWIAFLVLVIGIVIGVIGATIGLRRFLRT